MFVCRPQPGPGAHEHDRDTDPISPSCPTTLVRASRRSSQTQSSRSVSGRYPELHGRFVHATDDLDELGRRASAPCRTPRTLGLVPSGASDRIASRGHARGDDGGRPDDLRCPRRRRSVPARRPARCCASTGNRSRSASDLAPGHAQPVRVLGEDLTVYRDEAATSRRRRRPLRAPRHAPPHRLGRRRLHPLLLPRLEVRPIGRVRRATGRASRASRRRRDRRLPRRGVRGPGLRPPRSGRSAAAAALPGARRAGASRSCAGIRPPGPWPMNYFQALENNVDPVHLSFVHRATEPFTREVPEVRAARVRAGGISMTAIRGGVARSTTYWFPR